MSLGVESSGAASGAPPSTPRSGAGPEAHREKVSFFSRFSPELLDRLRAALGGAILLAALLSMLQWWSDGVRPATMADLTRDTESGLIAQWFPADSVSFRTGTPSRFQPSRPEISDSRIGPDNTGLFIVWRTKDYGFGMGHWQIASPVVDVFAPTSSAGGSAKNPRIEAAIAEMTKQPSAKRVSAAALKPSDTPLWLWGLGILAIVNFFVGRPPAFGTRWFWFWFSAIGALAVGAYAVTELIGWRPKLWPKRPLSGLVGFGLATVGALVVGVILMLVLPWARSTLGLALPL